MDAGFIGVADVRELSCLQLFGGTASFCGLKKTIRQKKSWVSSGSGSLPSE
jgi:hypothetical protein